MSVGDLKLTDKLCLPLASLYLHEVVLRNGYTIHLFLDDSDIIENDPEYETLFNAGKYEEAFALPKRFISSYVSGLKALWEKKVRVHVFTRRVDTVRLEKTLKSIEETEGVPGVFASCFSLRNSENQVVSLSSMMKKALPAEEGEHHAVVYCTFGTYLDEVKDSDLKEHFASVHTVKMQ